MSSPSPSLQDYKSFFESKTVWGGLIAFIAGCGLLGKYTITPADQATVVDLITGISAQIGSALAIYGRVTATKQIG